MATEKTCSSEVGQRQYLPQRSIETIAICWSQHFYDPCYGTYRHHGNKEKTK